MILETVNTFFTNIKQKTSNPFFGTLIFVWFVKNWELIYTIFNFDTCYTLNDKKNFIRSYFKDKNIWLEIAENILITIILLLIGYLFLVLSRMLANFIEHNITPKTNKIVASKLVVNKTVLEELEILLLKKTEELINERKITNEFELKIVDQRGKLDILNQEISNLKSEINQLNINILTREKSIKSLNKQNENISKEVIELRDSNNNSQKKLKENDENWIVKFNLFKNQNITPEVSDMYLELTNEGRYANFKKISEYIRHEISTRKDYDTEEILYYVKKGIFQFKNPTISDFGSPNLKLSSQGKILFDNSNIIEAEFMNLPW